MLQQLLQRSDLAAPLFSPGAPTKVVCPCWVVEHCRQQAVQ